jgi:hypothetical protein
MLRIVRQIMISVLKCYANDLMNTSWNNYEMTIKKELNNYESKMFMKHFLFK